MERFITTPLFYIWKGPSLPTFLCMGRPSLHTFLCMGRPSLHTFLYMERSFNTHFFIYRKVHHCTQRKTDGKVHHCTLFYIWKGPSLPTKNWWKGPAPPTFLYIERSITAHREKLMERSINTHFFIAVNSIRIRLGAQSGLIRSDHADLMTLLMELLGIVLHGQRNTIHHGRKTFIKQSNHRLSVFRVKPSTGRSLLLHLIH